MNYRHIYHAGNFADVFKHVMTVMAVEYLQQKDKGLFLMDAFAGCGLYNLGANEAQRTLEYEDGLARLMAADLQNPDLRRYRDLAAPRWNQNACPGSPLLLAELLRPQDRLLANELHPEDGQTLEMTLGRFGNVQVAHLDAYECIRANIPPEERRGLVLVDPPFEKKNEFELLARQVHQWKKRWETGCFMVWYPVKAHLQVDDFLDVAIDAGFKRTWIAECLIRDRAAEGTFNGCGMLVLNTPFQLPERMAALAPELEAILKAKIEMSTIEEGA